MKITDKTTPSGGMSEERARELLETPGTVFVVDACHPMIVTANGYLVLYSTGLEHTGAPATSYLHSWARGNLHFRSAELILRDFVDTERTP